MKKSVITGGMVLGLIVAFFMFREFNRPAGLQGDEPVAATVSAFELAEEYAADESAGNEKYLGKILQVSGEIQEIEGGTPLTVVLKGTESVQVRVEFQTAPAEELNTGETVTLRGTCSGMLLDVILNNARLND